MRVKRGVASKKRHKRIKKEVKGYIKVRRASIKKASEAILKAREHAYRGRKLKKRDFRGLFIVRLNNALREEGLNYSKFINDLKKKKIELNRKVLSEFAVQHPEQFKEFLEQLNK